MPKSVLRRKEFRQSSVILFSHAPDWGQKNEMIHVFMKKRDKKTKPEVTHQGADELHEAVQLTDEELSQVSGGLGVGHVAGLSVLGTAITGTVYGVHKVLDK